MRIDRLLSVLILIVLFLSLVIVSSVSAEESSNFDNMIEATFDITFDSATSLNVDITIETYKLKIFGEVYNADDIRDEFDENGSAFKHEIYEQLEEQISVMYPNSEILNFQGAPRVNENSLLATSDSDRLNPPVVFYKTFNVNLSSEFFNLNENANVYDVIHGVLDIGGKINYDFNLVANEGWKNTFIFDFSKNWMNLEYANTDKTSGNNGILWELNNWIEGNMQKQALITLSSKTPTTDSLNSQKIKIDFIIDSADVENTNLQVILNIESINFQEYLNYTPSSLENIDFIPSDGIRLFVENGLTNWSAIYEKTIKPIENEIEEKIENSSYNQDINLIFNWYENTTTQTSQPYDINNMNEYPSIKTELIDENINFKIFNISNRAFFGCVNSGGEANISSEDINFGDNIEDINYDYNITLILPDEIYLDGENTYKWNKTQKITGKINSEGAPEYKKEIKETIIEIEVQTTDLNLLSSLTGNTEITFGLHIKERRRYNVTSIPESFEIPPSINIDFLNSDMYRLWFDENLFEDEDINKYLDYEKSIFNNRVKGILKNIDIKGKSHIKDEVFYDSLNDWDQSITNMKDGSALEINAFAQSSYPISFDIAFLPPSFDISTQLFNFTGIDNHNVTYRIVFPNGLDVKAKDSLNKLSVYKKADGRQYIEINFNETEGNLSTLVNCELIGSGVFIVGVFMPCIISFLVAIILIVIICLVRKKRREGGGRFLNKISKKEDTIDYEDEDYYVPPPPEGK